MERTQKGTMEVTQWLSWFLGTLNLMLDGFEGKLTSSKWAAIAKCSPDTAQRDITQLLALGVLQKSPGAGRSAGYLLVDGDIAR